MKKLIGLLVLGGGALALVARALGWPSGGALLALELAYAVALVAAFVWFRKVWFYRDPARVPERNGHVIVSPADGKVMYVERVEDGRVVSTKLGTEIPITEITKANGFESGKGWLIGIYMSPGDVHFNYAPHPGRVVRIVHHQARVNLPMVDLWEYLSFMVLRRAVNLFARRFHFENERATLVLKGSRILSAVVLIADKFVNKIELFVEELQEIREGQKLSFIGRGSQVDLFVAGADVRVLVRPQQQVYGGKTILAEY